MARRIDEQVLDDARDAAAAGGQRGADEGRDETGSVHALPAGFHTSGQAPSSGAQGAPTLECSWPSAATLPLLVALACLLGLVVVGVLALAVPAGHERDAAMLHGFVALDRPACGSRSTSSPTSATRCPTRCAGLVCVGVALARGRGWRALAVVCLLARYG